MFPLSDPIIGSLNANNTNYTNEEEKVGKWIDGKTIYRKVINSTVGEIQDAMNALNADLVVSFFGMALSNYGNWFLIPCKNPSTIDYNNGDNYTISMIQSNYTERDFKLTFGSYYNTSNSAYVIMQYTKKEV